MLHLIKVKTMEVKEMIKLVLVRHGQSAWNLENKFTGWTDVELSEQGIREAIEAGKILKEKGYHFDLAFTSVLKRAEDTLDYILKEMNEEDIEIKRSWKLNERHYGALQDLNKDETRKKYGDEQVLLWRRSTDVRPPELDITDTRYPGNDEKYRDLTKEELPRTENLIDTIKRVIDYWNSDIKPEIEKGKKIIIVAHGNSLRGLIKYLDNISDEDIIKLELQTGNPICYELDDNLKPINHYYVKDK
jgi:2,3-bisphosphoglycerate-dependent phosphoglycerate mutase